MATIHWADKSHHGGRIEISDHDYFCICVEANRLGTTPSDMIQHILLDYVKQRYGTIPTHEEAREWE